MLVRAGGGARVKLERPWSLAPSVRIYFSGAGRFGWAKNPRGLVPLGRGHYLETQVHVAPSECDTPLVHVLLTTPIV